MKGQNWNSKLKKKFWCILESQFFVNAIHTRIPTLNENVAFVERRSRLSCIWHLQQFWFKVYGIIRTTLVIKALSFFLSIKLIVHRRCHSDFFKTFCSLSLWCKFIFNIFLLHNRFSENIISAIVIRNAKIFRFFRFSWLCIFYTIRSWIKPKFL